MAKFERNPSRRFTEKLKTNLQIVNIWMLEAFTCHTQHPQGYLEDTTLLPKPDVTIEKNRLLDQRAAIRGSNPAKNPAVIRR